MGTRHDDQNGSQPITCKLTHLVGLLMPASSARYWLDIPAPTRRLGKRLLHQQMWLFGRDIWHPQGNALYRYGFTHQKPPDGRGSPMYTWCDGREQVVLWAFGLFLGQEDNGGIYVNRYLFRPRFTHTPFIEQFAAAPEALTGFYHPAQEVEAEKMRLLFAEVWQWCGRYEAWAQENLGLKYRETAVTAFPHACTARCDVGQLPEMWAQIAAACQHAPLKHRPIREKL